MAWLFAPYDGGISNGLLVGLLVYVFISGLVTGALFRGRR